MFLINNLIFLIFLVPFVFNKAIAGEITKTVNVIYFFERDGDQNPSSDPNWYYYWSQTSASSGNHEYEDRDDVYGSYTPGDDHFHICNPARLRNDNTNNDGIDCFAETCIHENLHQTHWENWHNEPDNDGDWLPDWYEDRGQDGIPNTNDAGEGNGQYDPGEPSDVNNHDTDGDGRDDEEELCYDAEHNWAAGSADSEDWANPGKQY
jgi:hypothetical protein